MTIRLLIADHQAIVRQGLKRILFQTPHIQVAGEAENGKQVMECLQKDSFDLIMLEMRLPDISGVDLIARILACDARLPILVFSAIDTPQVARLALQAGAADYMTKDSSPENLIAAIDRIVEKKRAAYVRQDGNGALVDDAMPHQRLSDRECQILRLLISGKRINDIAEELAISNKAVSTYKARLMQKMDFRSNAEMVCYGVAHGLLACKDF